MAQVLRTYFPKVIQWTNGLDLKELVGRKLDFVILLVFTLNILLVQTNVRRIVFWSGVLISLLGGNVTIR